MGIIAIITSTVLDQESEDSEADYNRIQQEKRPKSDVLTIQNLACLAKLRYVSLLKKIELFKCVAYTL